MNNTKEILDDMRRITIFTGEISSVHEESLQKWPYVVFDEIQEVEIKYDLTKEYTKETGEGYVIFNITGKDIDENDFQAQGEFGKKSDALTSWVRDMLWTEVRIEVYLNGRGYYWNSSIKNKSIPKNFKEYNNGLE